jgi:hypothetical protein
MNATRQTSRISSQPLKVDTRGAEAALFLLLVAILGTVIIETAGGPRTMLRMSAGLWSGSSPLTVLTGSPATDRRAPATIPSLLRRLPRLQSGCRA